LAALFNDTQQQATAKDTRGGGDDKSLPPLNRQDRAQILKQRRPTTDGSLSSPLLPSAP